MIKIENKDNEFDDKKIMTVMFTTRLMAMRMTRKRRMMMMMMTAMMKDLTLDAEKYLVCSWKMSHWRSGGAAEFEEAAKPKRDRPSFLIFLMCQQGPKG